MKLGKKASIFQFPSSLLCSYIDLSQGRQAALFKTLKMFVKSDRFSAK